METNISNVSGNKIGVTALSGSTTDALNLADGSGFGVRGGQIGLYVESEATISLLTNTGELAGNLFGGVNYGSIGAMTNTGTIVNGFVNYGSIGSVNNTGTVTNGIMNYGTVTGKVALGDNTQYIAAGDASSVGGVISWNGEKDGKAGHGASVAVGNAANRGLTTTAGTVYVDNVSVAKGSVLTVTKDNDWHILTTGADALSNYGTLIMNNDSNLTGNLTNAGMLTMNPQPDVSATVTGDVVNDATGRIVLNPTATSAGNTLTIDGNYIGVAGSIVSLGGVLAGDDSLTDKLVITGDSSGESILNIANENGSGAQTLDGIQVVDVGGTSDAKFSLASRVVAGAYDYTLQKGNTSGTEDKDWYLTS
ncbi:autotransporter outer membrane beta-barrel domain-containing protein, partial [Enterobacter ludwigii]